MINRIKQVINYIFSKPKAEEIKKFKFFLSPQEYEIFLNMDKYDKIHCLGVYNKVKMDELLREDNLYIKLALLHDCGKENISLFRRIKKVLIGDKLVERHPRLGYEKLKEIDFELAVLILNHHSIDGNKKLKRFQEIDNKS